MSADQLGGMDEALQPITFNDALRYLHALIGKPVKVELNDYGFFFGCGYQGRLERVESLSRDDKSIRIVIAGGEVQVGEDRTMSSGGEFFIDPTKVKTFLAGDEEIGPRWLELQRPDGPVVTVESSRPIDA